MPAEITAPEQTERQLRAQVLRLAHRCYPHRRRFSVVVEPAPQPHLVIAVLRCRDRNFAYFELSGQVAVWPADALASLAAALRAQLASTPATARDVMPRT